jgi:hypothetical protein
VAQPAGVRLPVGNWIVVPKAHVIAVLLWGAAAALAVALIAATFLFLDAPRWALWGCFLGGRFLAVALFVIAVVVALKDGGKTLPFALRRRFEVLMAAGAQLLLIVFASAGWYFWPTDPLDKRLPGFGGYALLRIFDTPDFRRKYTQLWSMTGRYSVARSRSSSNWVNANGKMPRSVPTAIVKIQVHLDFLKLACGPKHFPIRR